MAELSHVRKRILSVIVALAVIDAAALVYLALPLRSGAAQPLQVQRGAVARGRNAAKQRDVRAMRAQRARQRRGDPRAELDDRLVGQPADRHRERRKSSSQDDWR